MGGRNAAKSLKVSVPMITFSDIEKAAAAITGEVVRTPMLAAPRLSALTGAEVFVKYENMQATGSFKERGACNRMRQLTEAEKQRGVIAMSAGNHAQAVAWHARKLGVSAVIVMPEATPHVKVENTRALGASVILEGATLAESQIAVERLIGEKGLVLMMTLSSRGRAPPASKCWLRRLILTCWSCRSAAAA
jgi:threonine dehydratase